MTYDLTGCRGLAAAVIRRSVRDLRDGRPCNGKCRDDEHVCAADAQAFLRSDPAAWWCDAIEVDPAALLEAVADTG